MTSHQRSGYVERFGVGLLVLLTLVFIAYLYFRSSLSMTEPLLNSNQAIQDARIRELETVISKLELQGATTLQNKTKVTPEEAYQEGLRQHEALLAEVRTELKVAQDQMRESGDVLKTARETTQRMQDAEAAFLAIFAIIGTLIAGQGYFQIRGWNERAEEALKNVDVVMPDINSIRDVRNTLETELPTFLDAARGILNVEDATGPIQQKDIALMDQIDHFTFLSTPMRFRKECSDEEAEKYIEGLRVAARGHLARKATWETMDRLDEFFVLAQKYPKAVTLKNKALAYSYRAVCAHLQLSDLTHKESWIRHSKAAEIVQIRDRGFADSKSARECYTQQNYGDFAEALLYSLQLAPEAVGTQLPADQVILQGQRKAVELYRKLKVSSTGRKRRGTLQNLACCLKRIADMTGNQVDYVAFETELKSYPSDKELCELTATEAAGRIDLNFLWQGMMSDEELFATVKALDANHYRGFWTALLDEKVTLRKWRDDLAELQARNPKMKLWAITL